MPRPLIGITVHNKEQVPLPGAYESGTRYAQFVAQAGGLPVLLPQEVGLVDDYVDRCDGFVFSGGDDVDVRTFGVPLHPKAVLMDPRRQAFDLALLGRLATRRPEAPVLGICLGMQLMALQAGGRIIQHLHDRLGEAGGQAHGGNRRHPYVSDVPHPALASTEGTVVSSHHQAVEDPAGLRVLGRAPDGTIEALDDPARPFYLGIQWHPERAVVEKGDSEALNLGPFQALIAASRSAR